MRCCPEVSSSSIFLLCCHCDLGVGGVGWDCVGPGAVQMWDGACPSLRRGISFETENKGQGSVVTALGCAMNCARLVSHHAGGSDAVEASFQ